MADAQPAPQHIPFSTESERAGAIYAQALIGAAESAGRTDDVLAELDAFVSEVLDRLRQFERVLASGMVSAEDKVGLLDRALKGQASPLFLNFLKVTARHGRLDALRSIQRHAHRIYSRLRGLVPVEVRTAVPLSDALAERIVQRLRKSLPGQPVLLRRTDPGMLGGLVIRVGDTVFDASVATQLAQLRKRISQRSMHEIQSRRDRLGHPAGDRAV